MKGWNDLGQGGRTAVVSVAALGAGLLIYFLATEVFAPRPPAQQALAPAAGSAPSAPAQAAPDKTAEAAAKASPAPEAKTAAASPEKAPSSEKPAAAPVPGAPAFDVVRVDAEGNALVAGRAVANAAVDVLVDGAKVAAAVADAQGKFVALFTLAPSEKPRVVTLLEHLADGTEIASADSAVVAPSGAPVAVASAEPSGTGAATATPSAIESAANGFAPSTTPLPGATANAAAPGAAGQAGATATGQAQNGPAPQAADQATESAQASAQTSAPATAALPGKTAHTEAAAEAPKSSSPQPSATGAGATQTVDGTTRAAQAPAVLLADKNGVRVLQPGGSAPSTQQDLVIGSIAYSSTGDVTLSGRGLPGNFVRLYLNNKAVLTARIEADGNWKSQLPEVDAGIYALRADELDSQGKVTSRFETPFLREDPAQLAAAGIGAAPAFGVSAAIITVQPGYTLWGIAKASYGHGPLYVKVFEANREQIRNPDLIYPGQVFSVPATE